MDISPRKDEVAPKLTASAGFMHMFDGIHFKFPSYKHDHPPVINVNEVADEELTVGQKVADRVASTVGSWRFIIIQSCILLLWIILNSIQLLFKPFDSYPFILLNLALSFQAAYSAPFVMMSQNRQAEKDRLTAQNDYQTDCKGEEEIRFIMEHLDHQDTVLFQLVKRIEEQHAEIKEHLVRLDPTLAQKLGMDVVELSKESLEGDSEIKGNS